MPLEPRVDNPDEVIGLIVLSDETALQVLDMLEKMTGKIILRRQDIAAVKINFNSRGELTKGEAVLALESLLSLNSIMLTDMGGRFMKAVPATSVNSHVPEMIVGSTLACLRVNKSTPNCSSSITYRPKRPAAPPSPHCCRKTPASLSFPNQTQC